MLGRCVCRSWVGCYSRLIAFAVLAGDVAVAVDEVGSAAVWRADEDGFAFVALNGGIEFGSHFGAEAKLFWCEIRHGVVWSRRCVQNAR